MRILAIILMATACAHAQGYWKPQRSGEAGCSLDGIHWFASRNGICFPSDAPGMIDTRVYEPRPQSCVQKAVDIILARNLGHVSIYCDTTDGEPKIEP